MKPSNSIHAQSAIVIGLCSHGLATVRSLARYDVDVHAIESNDSLPGFHTKCATVHLVDGIHGDELVVSLKSLAPLFPGQKPILFPVNDKMVECLASNWDSLRDSFQLSWQDSRGTVNRYLKKENLEQRCISQGIPYPETWTVDRLESVETLREAVFPIIVKPSQPLGSFKTRLARSFDDLVSIARSYPDDYPLLAQRWIEGDDGRLFFCALFLDHGNIIARFDGHKLASYPPTLGQTTIAEPVADDEVFRATEKFFAGLGISGPVSLEIKRDSDGGIWVIEPTVGRTDFWLSLCAHNGVPLPFIEYCFVTGKSFEIPVGGAAVRWFDTEKDVLAYVKYLRTGGGKRGWRATFPYLDRRDMKPFWRALARRVGRSVRRVFP